MSSKKLTVRYGYLVSILAVVLVTAVFYFGRDYFAKGQWALLYLLVILGVASIRGVKPAVLTAILSFLAWNYFLLPPYQTFTVSDPKDWLFLSIFLIVGVIVGLQTGKLKQSELYALSRESEADRLNRFSAHLVSDIPVQDLAKFLANQALEVSLSNRVSVFLSNDSDKLELAFSHGESRKDDDEIEKIAHWSYAHSKAVGLPDYRGAERAQLPVPPISVSYRETGSEVDQKGMFLPLQTAQRRLGALFVGEKADGAPFAMQEIRALSAMCYQASAFLERKKLQRLEITAEARSMTDKLKSTIISSIHHELKTPLASVNATVGNLLETDTNLSDASVKEELHIIQEDLRRLNSSIGSLVELSRLEASDWEPKKEWYEFGEILGDSLSRLTGKDRDRILLDGVDDALEMEVDFIQISRVLQIIIENALAYSGKNSSVKVGAKSTNGDIRIWIEDSGPGISNEEKQHVFDKFYRGKAAGSPGTGLGLAIALEIIDFHGGTIVIEDVHPRGARFVVILPVPIKSDVV